MGLFDNIAGEAMGKLTGQGSGQSGLLDGVMDLLGNNQAGGIGGLVQSFKDKGLGDIVSSWVGTDSNLPISPEQIQQALGAEKIQQLAGKAGVSPEAASANLADLLPNIIDKLTPSGQLPSGDLLNQGLGLLKSKLLG